MHGSILGWFINAVRPTDINGKDVLEVGSKDANGTIRPMIEYHRPRTYLGVDIEPGPGVDAEINCEQLTDVLGENCADVVISTEMLEHVEDWQQCVRQMIAALRPGGILLWTTRSPGFQYHNPPDHWRYTQPAFVEIIDRAGLEPQVICADPEKKGVFVRARKPVDWTGWANPSLDGIDGVKPVQKPLTILGMPFAPDGCGYYRFWSPYKQIAENTEHIINIPKPGEPVIPTFDDVEQLDCLIQQRPSGKACDSMWQRWQGMTKLVYETDDPVWLADTNLAHWLHEGPQQTTINCLRRADLVTVSTEPLAEAARQHNPNVVVIPNYVHEDLLAIQRPQREHVTVCWSGGATHLQDIAMIQEPLGDVLASTPHTQMHWLGIDFSPLIRRESRFTDWQTNVWNYYQAIDGDLAVIPLRDTPFNRCRTNIKALEYAALGIPVVASDIEPYRGFVIDGVTGYLATSDDEWRQRIRDLIHDTDMRHEMGAKAKQLAADWTIQQHWHEWVDAYNTIID